MEIQADSKVIVSQSSLGSLDNGIAVRSRVFACDAPAVRELVFDAQAAIDMAGANGDSSLIAIGASITQLAIRLPFTGWESQLGAAPE